MDYLGREGQLHTSLNMEKLSWLQIEREGSVKRNHFAIAGFEDRGKGSKAMETWEASRNWKRQTDFPLETL